MRVAILLWTLGGGGVDRNALNLIPEFQRAGCEVDLVLLQAEKSVTARRAEVPEDVRVVDLHTTERRFVGVLALVRYLRRERPDALLSSVYPRNLIALWARGLSRAPTRIVVTEHTMLSVAVANRRSRTGPLIPRLIRWSYPRASAVVAVSDGVADDLATVTGLARESVIVVQSPVITPRLRELVHEPVPHPWFDADIPIVLSVGRLSREKDHSTLLRAFHQLRRTHPSRLVILGEGPERTRLEHQVRSLDLTDDVSLPGFVANPYAYMARASVFALSSVEEGLGNVLVEALACGCPAVSTDCPSGPREILKDGKFGSLVPTGDPTLLAEAIVEALANPPMPEFLKARAEAFSSEHAAAKYLQLLNHGTA